MRSNSRKEFTFIELARRQQIIDATIESAAKEGYAGTAVSKVAQKVNISKSVVLYHFRNKDELIEETVTQIYDSLWSFVQPRILAESTANAQLRAYIEAEFEYLEMNRDQLLALSSIITNHRNKQGDLYLLEKATEAYLDLIGPMLEAGQQSGDFRSFAIVPMARTLMHAINGALEHWVRHPDISLRDYAGELMTLFDLATQQ
ncbi:MAG: TetR family transcriptional regulator [Opitutales bacterium]|nr:TetR family transcriptional regulator [Opitutales bacterium]